MVTANLADTPSLGVWQGIGHGQNRAIHVVFDTTVVFFELVEKLANTGSDALVHVRAGFGLKGYVIYKCVKHYLGLVYAAKGMDAARFATVFGVHPGYASRVPR